MKNNYNLTTLLKLRELNKDSAERTLYAACQELELQQKKLALIEKQLSQKKLDRTQMQDNFFQKALKAPCNKREVSCLVLSAQKNINDESSLKNMLLDQLEQVKGAQIRQNDARQSVIEAQQNFKAISKHHSMWQQGQKRREDIESQSASDDLNSTRFSLRTRA